MEWRGRFADMLEELEARNGQLGVTHFAVSMPTLEEVFLRCTAESHQRDGDSSPADTSTDGRCEITLTPQSKQALPASPSSDTSAARSAGQASSAASPAGSSGNNPSESANGSRPASSDGGDNGQPSRPPLPISRDDSAEAFSSVLAAAADDAVGERKTPERGSQSASTSRQRSQDTPLSEESQDAAGKGERTGASAVPAAADCAALVSENGAGEAQCTEEVLEEVPLHEPTVKRRPRRVRWWVAFREMLRKRAIIAGEDCSHCLLILLLPLQAPLHNLQLHFT